MLATSELALDCPRDVPKSRGRRLRATHMKRRMWTAATFNNAGFQQMFLPTWWQPEPEATGFEGTANASYTAPEFSCDHHHPTMRVKQSALEQGDPQVDEYPIEGLKSVTQALDMLNEQLSDILYNDGFWSQIQSDVQLHNSSDEVHEILLPHQTTMRAKPISRMNLRHRLIAV